MRGARSAPGSGEQKAEKLKLPRWALCGFFFIKKKNLPLITRRTHQVSPAARRWLMQTTSPLGGPDAKLGMYVHTCSSSSTRMQASRQASKAKQADMQSPTEKQSVFAQRKHRDRHPSWSCGAALRRAATNRASQPPFELTETPLKHGLHGKEVMPDGGAIVLECMYVLITRTVLLWYLTGGKPGYLLHPTPHFNANQSPIWANSVMVCTKETLSFASHYPSAAGQSRLAACASLRSLDLDPRCIHRTDTLTP